MVEEEVLDDVTDIGAAVGPEKTHNQALHHYIIKTSSYSRATIVIAVIWLLGSSPRELEAFTVTAYLLSSSSPVIV